MNTEKRIGFTKVALPYGWLGNMSPYPIEYGGIIWRTTEALFQAMRFDDIEIRHLIRDEKSPMGAKFKAKANKDKMNVEPLSKIDIGQMAICIKLKIDQHPNIKQWLIETGDAYIFEDVTSRANKGNNLFWGAALIDGELVGTNTLGKLWMSARKCLIEK